MTVHLLDIPSEILLYICKSLSTFIGPRDSFAPVSFLDIPELEALARASRKLAALTSDPVLHHHRLKVVSPSRVNHGLFGKGPQGDALRPTLGDLVQRGVIRGLGVERRWRNGNYLYSTIVSSRPLQEASYH